MAPSRGAGVRGPVLLQDFGASSPPHRGGADLVMVRYPLTLPRFVGARTWCIGPPIGPPDGIRGTAGRPAGRAGSRRAGGRRARGGVVPPGPPGGGGRVVDDPGPPARRPPGGGPAALVPALRACPGTGRGGPRSETHRPRPDQEGPIGRSAGTARSRSRATPAGRAPTAGRSARCRGRRSSGGRSTGTPRQAGAARCPGRRSTIGRDDQPPGRSRPHPDQHLPRRHRGSDPGRHPVHAHRVPGGRGGPVLPPAVDPGPSRHRPHLPRAPRFGCPARPRRPWSTTCPASSRRDPAARPARATFPSCSPRTPRRPISPWSSTPCWAPTRSAPSPTWTSTSSTASPASSRPSRPGCRPSGGRSTSGSTALQAELVDRHKTGRASVDGLLK